MLIFALHFVVLYSANFIFAIAAPKLNCSLQDRALHCQYLTPARALSRHLAPMPKKLVVPDVDNDI